MNNSSGTFSRLMTARQVHKRKSAIHCHRFFLSLAFLFFSSSGQAQITVSPSAATGGSHVAISAANVDASGQVTFWLSDGVERTNLGDAIVQRGRASVYTQLPRWMSGDYTLSLEQRERRLDSIEYTLQAAATLKLLPTFGPPGSWVSLSADDLSGDVYEVRYNGQLILGPTSLPARAVTIDFEVPANELVAGNKLIQLITYRGNTVVDQATGMFLQTPPQSIAPPQLIAPQVMFDELSGQQLISGQLLARLGESIENYDVSLVFKTTDGQAIPLPSRLDLLPDGRFAAQVGPQNMFNVAAAGVDGDFVLAIVIPENDRNGGQQQSQYEFSVGSASFTDDIGAPITVRVMSGAGGPVTGATVLIKAGTAIAGGSPQGTQAQHQSAWVGAVTKNFFGVAQLPPEISKCGFTAYKDTANAQGEVEFSINPLDFREFVLENIGQCTPISNGTSQDILCPPLAPDIPLIVWVSALKQDHGWLVDGKFVGGIYPMMLRYQGKWQLFGLNDPAVLNGVDFSDLSLTPEQLSDPEAFTIPIDSTAPLTFTLPPISSPIGAQGSITATPEIDGLLPNTAGITDTYHGVISLRRDGQLTTAQVIASDPEISFPVPGIESAYVAARLILDGVDLGLMSRREENPCSADPFDGDSATKFFTNIPASMLFDRALGSMIDGVIQATDTDGQLFSKTFTIEVTGQVPAWINNAENYENRRVEWTTAGIRLAADEKVSMAAIDSPDLDYDIGTLENDTANAAAVTQEVSATGAGEVRRLALSVNQVASNDGDDQSFNTTQTNDSPQIVIGPKTIEIIDTGKLPLFRYVWGIWPIASATLGADISIKANLVYKSIISFIDNYYELVVAPQSEIELSLFFDASILFDIVKAEAEAIANVLVQVPVKTINGLTTTDECFEFGLDVEYEVSVGPCPFCIGANDTEELIATQTQCSIAKKSGPGVYIKATGESLRTASPDVTFSPAGHGMMSYIDDDGQLMAQQLTLGEMVNAPSLIGEIPGLMDPQVEFIDPHTVVLLAARSSLDMNDFMTREFSQSDSSVTRFQHIVYAQWQLGETPSLQPLTLPTTGEGSPRLAACIGQGRTCLNSQATAVWVKDMAGDIGAYRSQVFFSSLVNDQWTAPRVVDPTLSSDAQVKDGQPTVTYWDTPTGPKPVIAWVRNPSGSLANLGSRQMMFRILDGVHTATEVTELPHSVASPSLVQDGDGGLNLAYTVANDPAAFIGDQRTLHWARYSCEADCQWSNTEVTDSFGRTIKAERPTLVSGEFGTAVAFRLLGFFGPDGLPSALPSDPIAASLGGGTIAMAYLSIADSVAPEAVVQALEPDQFAHWDMAVAFDPSTGVNVVASAIPSPIRAGNVAAKPQASQRLKTPIAKTRVQNSRATLLRPSLGRDIAITGIELIDRPDGGTVEVLVRFESLGIPTTLNPNELPVRFTVNGRLGYLGVVEADASCAAESTQSLRCSVALPASYRLDENVSLTVELTDETLKDRDRSNDFASLQLGLMPIPSDVTVRSSANDFFNYVDWNPTTDPRTSGYRVYRARPGETPLPVGTSQTNSWADADHPGRSDYEYFVTSYSARGFESQLSEPSPLAKAKPRVASRLFSDSFELAKPQ